MKFTLLSLIGSAAAFTASTHAESLESRFETFINTYNKVYSSDEEKQARFLVFVQNAARVAQLNTSGSVTFEMNKFSDLTDAEREHIHLTGFRSGIPAGLEELPVGPLALRGDNLGVDHADCYTTIRDQGQCGSCWAFATTAVVEGAHCVAYGTKVDLAPQQLVDCDNEQAGCNGAYTLTEPVNFAKEHGVCLESEYKYTARDGTCNTQGCTVKYGLASWDDLSGQSAQEIIDHLENHGPLSVGVGVGFAFQMYRGGIMTKALCGSSRPNHAVTLVGYEIIDEKPIFKIRNSWGASWGEAGHIRVEWGACQLGSMIVAAEAGEKVEEPAPKFLKI